MPEVTCSAGVCTQVCACMRMSRWGLILTHGGTIQRGTVMQNELKPLLFTFSPRQGTEGQGDAEDIDLV